VSADVESVFGEAYAGTNSNQRCQCSLVESEGSLILQDLGRAVKGAGILSGRLEPDLDDVYEGSEVVR
jgi:hypothetical protein